MADKPSRALVLYAAGHAALLPRAAAGAGGGKSLLDAFAALASCGFLSLRTPATVNDGGDKNSDTILELAQLLDVYDALYPAETARADPQDLVIPKLSERFMGMRAAMVTNCPAVSSFAANLGFTVFGTEDFATQSGADSGSKDSRVIDRAFGLLGFAEGNVQDSSEFDLVFVHVATENTAGKLGKLGMKTDLNRLDRLVAAVMESAPVGSAVAARIHVSVICSYGSATEKKEESCLILNSSTETDSDLKLLRPRQSYTMKAGKTLDDVRNHHPMLVAQWQEGVTRSDFAKDFSFEEFIKRAGNFAMLAERFLHEVAFKLWKAPKYGA